MFTENSSPVYLHMLQNGFDLFLRGSNISISKAQLHQIGIEPHTVIKVLIS